MLIAWKLSFIYNLITNYMSLTTNVINASFKQSCMASNRRDLHTSHGKFQDILRFRLWLEILKRRIPAHILMGLQSHWELQPIYFIFLCNWSEIQNYSPPRAILWWNKSRHTHRTPFPLILLLSRVHFATPFSDHLRISHRR